MADFSDIGATLKDEAKKRLAHPITGAYIFAWAAWNFRLLLVLLSPGSYEAKLLFIRGMYPMQSDWWATSLIPLIIAIVYAGVAPLMALGVETWTGIVDWGRARVTLWLANERPVSRKEISDRLAASAAVEADLQRKLEEATASTATARSDAMQIRAFARKQLYCHARERVRSYSASAWTPLAGAQKLTMISIRERGKFEEDVLRALENQGLPLLSYKLLKLFAANEVHALSSILNCVGRGTVEELPDEFLLLLGFSFLDVHWNAGTLPHFQLSQTGKEFLAYLEGNHAASFAQVQID